MRRRRSRSCPSLIVGKCRGDGVTQVECEDFVKLLRGVPLNLNLEQYRRFAGVEGDASRKRLRSPRPQPPGSGPGQDCQYVCDANRLIARGGERNVEDGVGCP